MAKGQRLLLAVSGGQDSLCLLQVLRDLAPRWQWQLFVLHCDHRWTPDETECARFLATWIRQQGLPCQVETADPITLDEQRARQWRYQMLADWATRWDCHAVVTGHTGSDQAETFLFNLLRGSGSQGLISLDWQRPLDQSRPTSAKLVRPLLGVWRQETAEFCQHYHLPVWPDRSNQDLTHARNRIRQELIPYLQTHFNPQVEEALTRTAAILQAEHAWLDAQAQQLWPQIYQKDPPRLQRVLMRQQALALQRQLLHRFLNQHLPRAPQFEQVEHLQRLLWAPRRSRTPTFPGGSWAEVEQDWIVLRVFESDYDPTSAKLAKGAYDSAIDLTEE